MNAKRSKSLKRFLIYFKIVWNLNNFSAPGSGSRFKTFEVFVKIFIDWIGGHASQGISCQDKELNLMRRGMTYLRKESGSS